jgi:serine/threonine protein kinase
MKKRIDFKLDISRDGLSFNGTPLPLPPSLIPISKIGEGASGFVVRCRNELLDRDEAVKFWVKLREGDTRDKLKQGVEEARKAAFFSSERVAQIYSAGTALEKYFYVAMEYCEGQTLGNFLFSLEDNHPHPGFPSYQYRYNAAVQYLTVIKETAGHGLLHGDAHPGNVIVRTPPFNTVWPPPVRLKLLDFGTSIFNQRGNSVDRHWRIVDRTMDLILGKHTIYEEYRGAKPFPTQWEHLIDFYMRVLLALSYSYANKESPLPDIRPISGPI